MNISATLKNQCNKAIDFVFPPPVIVIKDGKKYSPGLDLYSKTSRISVIGSAIFISIGIQTYNALEEWKICAARHVAASGTDNPRPTCDVWNIPSGDSNFFLAVGGFAALLAIYSRIQLLRINNALKAE